mmetsp:Transcript_27605/g.57776  ORF Transcript_27605/g.57776 Transcript_27605/m.57776 type:complete len:84 (+) Transcript_27605:590-841(+)
MSVVALSPATTAERWDLLFLSDDSAFCACYSMPPAAGSTMTWVQRVHWPATVSPGTSLIQEEACSFAQQQSSSSSRQKEATTC